MAYDPAKMTVKVVDPATVAEGDVVDAGRLADRYGRLKAQASDIATELDGIKAKLVEQHGECKIEGELFRLALSHSLRSNTDWRAVALHFAKKAGVTDKVFENQVAANTNCTDSWVARSSARVTK